MSNKDYCRGCVYRTYAGAEPICGYILVERRRRPCPPGEGCTVKVVGGNNKKMKRRTWDENRARQLYEEGKSDVVDIADMVGATAGAIAAWRSRNRLTSQNPPGRRSSAPAPIDAPTPAPVKESLAPIAVPPPEPKPAADISVEETRPVAEKKPISTKERRIKQPDGPVELALSIAGCACELTAPDIASAVWMAEHLCDSLKLIEKGTK